MAAVAGMVMAASGLIYAGVNGVSQTAQVRKEEEQGTYRGRFGDPSHVILDRYHQGWDKNQPIEAVNTGVWGSPRTFYGQPGKSIVPAYGIPKGNGMTNI